MCPTHSPQVVFSGLIDIVGKIIAHSLVQGGPGFPFLSLPCYYYLATGDVINSMAYCDPWDIPDTVSRQWVLKVFNPVNCFTVIILKHTIVDEMGNLKHCLFHGNKCLLLYMPLCCF